MADKAEPRGRDETPVDRMMRFGTALFAVPKDEIPKRDERKKTPRKKPKAAPGA